MQAKQQREREAAEARERDTVLEGEDATGGETARDTERANVIPTDGDDEENLAEDGGPGMLYIFIVGACSETIQRLFEVL
jgi:hypothetical protein